LSGSIDSQDVGHAGLCRATERHTGRHSKELEEHLLYMGYNIATILGVHNQQAKADNGPAIFAFTDYEHEQLVGGLVTEAQWEIIRSKNKDDFLLPASPNHPTKWMVIEVAAALMAAASKDNGFNIIKNKGDRKALVQAAMQN